MDDKEVRRIVNEFKEVIQYVDTNTLTILMKRIQVQLFHRDALPELKVNNNNNNNNNNNKKNRQPKK
jgi:hypothetical protein